MGIRNRASSTRKTEGLPRNRVQNFGTFRLTSKKEFIFESAFLFSQKMQLLRAFGRTYRPNTTAPLSVERVLMEAFALSAAEHNFGACPPITLARSTA